MATNGHHDNKDYDGLYESVMNFSTLKEGQGQSEKGGFNNNNIPHKMVTKSSSVLVTSSSSQGDSVKVNGNHRNSFHGELDRKISNNSTDSQSERMPEDDTPVPPKRPVRKKKSLRGKEDVSRTSSNSSQVTERSRSDSGAKMPMEYFSDSSEMSPRDSPSGSGRKNIGTDNRTNDLAKGDSSEIQRTVIDVKKHKDILEETEVKQNRVVPHDAKITPETNVPVSNVSKSSVDGCNDNDSGIVMSISKGGNHELSGGKGIIELGSNDQNEPLEVQTVEFSSQERSFKSGDFNKLCAEEIQGQRYVDEYVSEKLKSKTESKELGQALGSKLSSSLESLDDIDKILKEQVLKFLCMLGLKYQVYKFCVIIYTF